MTGHRPFSQLTKDWSAARHSRVDERKEELLADIEQAALAALRKALHVSQEELARTMGKSQAAVAQMERRTDMKVSTLREAIEAMGGELELVAHFPSGNIRITDLGEAAE
jgi:DNA-binding transcriptional regulator YiaG